MRRPRAAALRRLAAAALLLASLLRPRPARAARMTRGRNPKPKKNLCLMQYLVADNDLEFSITADLLELLDSNLVRQPNVQTWVYYDAHGGMHDYDGDGRDEAPLSEEAGPMFLWYDRAAEDLAVVGIFEEGNSDTPEVLCLFLTTAMADCLKGGAEEFALTLSSHGGGHLGFGGDLNYAPPGPGRNRRLWQSNRSVAAGVRCALDKVAGAPPKLDLLSFDACLMSSFLAVREYAPLAEHVLASESTVPGHGFYWHLPKSAAGSALSLGRTIHAAYLMEAQNDEDPGEHLTPKTLALIRTAGGFDAFRSAFEGLATELARTFRSGTDRDLVAAVRRARSGAVAFEAADDRPGTSRPSAADVGSFLGALREACDPDPTSRTARILARAVAAYDAQFVARGVGPGTKAATGMSVYFPSKK